MRAETCTFSAAAGMDRTVLEWVAAAAGRTTGLVETADDDNNNNNSNTTTTMTYASLTTHNSFTNTTTSQFAKGLVGCVRLLAAPELLLLSDDPLKAAVVESWLQVTEATLLPLLRSGTNNGT